MSTVLVTGPNGFVGSYVLPALLARGHEVVGLVRTAEAGEAVRARLGGPDRLRLVSGDVTDLASVTGALVGTDVVVHLAAIPRDRDGGASLRLVNTEGTRNVVAAMRSAGVRRLVHLGALGVADEPALHYASSKAKAEAVVAASDLDWTIVKPSLLWGERDGFFNIIAGLVRLAPGIVPVPGDGSARFQPLSVVDLARILALCVERPATIGQTYEIGGPRVWTYREITREVIEAMGAHRAILPMPVPLIALVAGTSELLHLPFPVATDQLRQLRLDNVTDPDSVARGFGFQPADMAGQLGYLRRKPRDQQDAPASVG
jgi:nucleoside-diphosphate-sugar epimerase